MSNEVVISFFGVLIINIGYQLMTRKDKKYEMKGTAAPQRKCK